MAVRLALLVLIVGCKTSHTLEAREDVKLSDVEHAQASGEKHEGPWTETVYEFAVAAPSASGAEPGDGSFEPTKPPDPRGINGTASPTGQPQLARITVRQHSGDAETWRSSSDGLVGAEETMQVKKADTATPAGCMLGLGFYGAIVLAGVCAAAGLYLKLKAKAAKALLP